MTIPLYRKEALKPRSQTLDGEVVLHRHIPSLVLTGLLAGAGGLAAAILWFGRIETADGPVRILHYLLQGGA